MVRLPSDSGYSTVSGLKLSLTAPLFCSNADPAQDRFGGLRGSELAFDVAARRSVQFGKH
jgi:hypothetical protein